MKTKVKDTLLLIGYFAVFLIKQHALEKKEDKA